jgi:hypothetical protein
VQAEADALFALSKKACDESRLPEKPDVKKAEELCMSLIRVYHGF